LVVNYDDICSWLGLPAGSWPPDYYRLLGLEQGESDRARIENQVHERMFLLRCRQLCHPEQVTEAMNLLARAFTCLTDLEAKRAYDAALVGGRSQASVAMTTEARPLVESVTAEPTDPLAWLFGPWSSGDSADGPSATVVENWVSAPPPQRLPVDVAQAVVSSAASPEANGVAAHDLPAKVAEAATSQPGPADLIARVASSPSARQGLHTRRALYQRLAQTRELLRTWNAAGKYLAQPQRRLGRSAEAIELARQLTAIRRQLRDFPRLLGEAGQPGFYVLTLASQPRKAIVATFRMLLPSQREMLTRDWRDGLILLSAHRRFVSQELRTWRQTRWFGRAVRAVDMVLSDHPGWLLGAVVLVAVAVAIWLGLSQ
jgi:hypothetical protein